MKKRSIKTLKLNKEIVTAFNTINGGVAPSRRHCNEYEEIDDSSMFIESNCYGCSITTVSG